MNPRRIIAYTCRAVIVLAALVAAGWVIWITWANSVEMLGFAGALWLLGKVIAGAVAVLLLVIGAGIDVRKG